MNQAAALIRICLVFACASAFCTPSHAAAPWQQSLSCDGGGHWNLRVRVEVDNPSDEPLEGAPALLHVKAEDPRCAPLVGQRVQGLRVTKEDGTELLFGAQDAAGNEKTDGALAAGDVLVIPAEAGPGMTSAYYVYAGNGDAWRPPKWLRGALTNPGFEEGEGAPAGWRASETTATHRMALERGGAHGGEACARCEVDAGGAPRWVKYLQGGIPLMSGKTYRFTAWVKAQDIRGKAGWYVHVDGERPQIVNRVEGWDGTFEWRQVSIVFEAPAQTATRFSCGTVLHGTGTAWYDDASLDLEGALGSLQAHATGVETREIEAAGASGPWLDEAHWRWRVPLRVCNPEETAATDRVASFDTRRAHNQIAKLIGFTKRPGVRLVDPEAPERPVVFAGDLSGDLHVLMSAPPRTEKTLWLYLSDLQAPAYATALALMLDWSAGPMNLLANGSMETGEGDRPEAWPVDEEGMKEGGRFTARRVRGGVHGQWCIELVVAQTVEDPGWFGWRQRVPVRPSTAYLLAGHVKTQTTDNPVRIHGHFQRADGRLTEGPFFGTDKELPRGDNDWTLTATRVVTPADCAFLEVHCTMNGHGTIWHDGLLLMESATGATGTLEPRKPPQQPLAAWVVNPMVKVFHEDWPPDEPVEEVAPAASRNSWEAFQIAVRSRDAATLDVAATPLTGPNGATLEPPLVYRVGFVPIDFPIGYDSKEAPAYYRLTPGHRGNDGWRGWWPDPLLRVEDGRLELEAGQTQPLCFDVHVPAEAPPGVYEGRVEFRVGDASVDLPVRFTVWRFVQPERKHLPAIYDLRSGSGGNVFSGPDPEQSVREWHRFLARYNVSPGILHSQPQFVWENGRVSMDTQAFDREMAYLLDELGIPAVYTPDVFYACGWAYTPRSFLGFEAFTPEYETAWTEAYRLFIDHITEKGWRSKFVYYLSDEPHESSEATITGLARVADMARAIAPDVPIYSSTWRYIEGLENHLTLWGIGPQGTFLEDKIPERRAAGDRFWFTTDGQMCTDTPYLGIERLLPWFCLKHDVEGYEFWGVSWWTYDPWDCGWHTYIRQSSEGEKWFWVRYPNGDGFLAYPPQPGDHEPVPSIRLVAAREGVDDFELFKALEAHAANGDEGAREALARVRERVHMPNRGGRYSTDVMPDPDAVQAARVAAGDTLNRLMGE